MAEKPELKAGHTFVTKRDGRREVYDERKLEASLKKAASPLSIEEDELKELTHIITNLALFNLSGSISTSEIAELSNQVLLEKGYTKLIQSRALYEAQKQRLRSTKTHQSALDYMI